MTRKGAGVALCVLVLAAGTCAWRPIVYERALVALDNPNVLDAPLCDDGVPLLRPIARLFPLSNASLANALLEHPSPRVSAAAFLLQWKPVVAAAALERDSATRDDAAWTNLAVAELAAARAERDHDRLLAALAAVSHVQFVPRAIFVRAVIVERLGMTPLAISLWKGYLAVDGSTQWASAARQHLRALQQVPSDLAAWNEAAPRTDRELADLARRFPQQAAASAEGPFLAWWGDAVQHGDAVRAARELRKASVIADVFAARTGDFLLQDIVASIEHSPSQTALAEGFVTYRAGRILLMNADPADGERAFIRARDLFTRGGSPMAEVVAFYEACTAFDQTRAEEAAATLRGLLDFNRYPTLVARAQYELSLYESTAGRWSDGLERARAASAIWQRLGHRGFTAMATAQLSSCYSFLGQPAMAWAYAIDALRGSCAAGDLYRARVVLAAACRIELRQQQWDRARALARLEQEMALLVPTPLLAFDLHMRAATAAFQLGDRQQVNREMLRATVAANALPDATVRKRALADIAGVAGTIARRDDPRLAVALLGGAIAFEAKAERSILLPQLLLERGRAYAVLHDVAHAHDDVEEGIRCLEQQRRRLNDADLRPGIFDDAEDLFAEAVSIELGRGDVAAAFAYVERGRARAMLEEIAGDDAAASPPSIAALASRIPEGGVFVEYAVLPHELVVFTIDGGRLAVRRVPVERAALQHDVRAFTAALKEHRPMAEIRPLATRLYATLIGTVADRTHDLIIVGDTLLQQVPFAALLDPRTHTWLVERCSIATAPSAAILVATQRSESPATPAAVAIFSDPTNDLTGADDEARRVAKQYPNASVLSGENATAAKFAAMAPLSGVVHFAGHAVTYAAEPWRSALVFAGDTLNAHDVARMHFRSTRLIVLAACTTFGRKRSGVEGVPSVARAFLVAGVPSVVGTLWDIDDREVADVVRRFHGGVARGLTPAAALREAQMAEIRAARHPAEWSAFAVLGRG